jgi:hypothetical protein
MTANTSTGVSTMRLRLSIAMLAALASGSSAAHATNISWTNWNPTSFVQTCPPTVGFPLPCQGGNYYYPAIATGTAISNGQPITVTLNGQFDSISNFPNWQATGSYAGGSVSNAPPQANNSILLRGGLSAANGNYYYQDTITFSSPVKNPVFSIWSLGANNGGLNPIPASFVFDAGQPFTIQAGGPGQQYGGTSITQNGETVNGLEGNGTIQFIGTYSQLTFTTPQFEDYYAFTVGAPTPEPSSLMLLGTGILGVVGVARKKMFKA